MPNAGTFQYFSRFFPCPCPAALLLCLPKSLSGANAFEISDIQESET